MTAILRLCVLLLAMGAGTSAQVVGAVDFEVRASLEGSFADVAVGPEGRIYLLDGKGETVTVFSPDLQRSLAVYDTRKSARIGRGVAIAVARDGSFWIADEGGILAAFDPLGLPQGQFRFPSKGAVSVQRPSAMAVDLDGAVVVADGARKTIVMMEPDGMVRSQVHGVQAQGVVFDDPIDVAVDRGGYLLVVDGSGGGVCRLDMWGTLRHRWSAATTGPAPLRSPRCVASDEAGLTFVADASGKCVTMADTSLVAVFGTLGSRPGQIQKPVAMAATPGGDLVILDADPPRVQVFGIPALQGIRQSLPKEERFLPVRVVAGQPWIWAGSRIDVHDGMLALAGQDRKTVLFGPWVGGSEQMQPVSPLAGRLKAVSDIALTTDGWIVVVDETARAVLVADPRGDAVEAVPCPLGTWKSPTRVVRGHDGMMVWDRGHKAIAVVLGDQQLSLPVRVKGDVVDIAAAPSGDIGVFTASGSFLVTPEGSHEEDVAALPGGFGAVAAGAYGVVAALDEGGLAAMTWERDLLALGGVAAGRTPSAVKAMDLAVDDSLVVALTADGMVAGYVLENAGRAGITGTVAADPADTFSLRLEPLAGGTTVTLPVPPGRFSVGGIVPGDYRWQIGAPGWLPARGESTVWLRSQRLSDVGTVTMRRAGRAVGRLNPPVISAALRAVRGDSVLASTLCGEDGVFVFSDLPPGDYGLLIDVAGFRPTEPPSRFTVVPGTTVEIPLISMMQMGGLKGYVKPLQPDQEAWVLRDGMLVRICRPELLADVDDEAATQPLGRFQCEDLEPGVYGLVVRSRGFYPDTTLPPIEVVEGQVSRCGTVVLSAAPPDSESAEGLRALQQAMEDYGQARFSIAQESIQRLLAARSIPYSALDQAYTLLGWCAVARGPSQVETARASFRLALMINPKLTPGPDASPTVAATMEDVSLGLLGAAGPPADAFIR